MRVMITTGGTGGHIFPALRTAAEFRRSGDEVFFAGVFKSAAEQIRQEGYPIFELAARGMALKNPLVLARSVAAMLVALGQAARILKKVRPDAVVGFGGYGGFAVALAAALSGIPTVIHEQNVFPGKANRLLAFFVRRVAVSFASGIKFFPQAKTVLTGYPLRLSAATAAPEEILERFGLSADKPTILVLGGSQGSRRINTAFMEMIPILQAKLDFQVIHACGEKDFGELKLRYSQTGIANYLTPFLHEMADAYSIAAVAVCRAGAGTVTELAAFGVGAVLIPYPFAGGHQRYNADVLAERGAAVIIDDAALTGAGLASTVEKLLCNPVLREQRAAPARGIYRADAAQKLTELARGIAR